MQLRPVQLPKRAVDLYSGDRSFGRGRELQCRRCRWSGTMRRSKTAFCDFGERFDCDTVNRSEYSSVMGIPVAGIGIVGYGVLLALATAYRTRVETPLRLLVAAVAGLGFALYLTYVEAYVLETWCICV